MLHQSHAGITGPALLIVVTYDVLIVGVWVLCQIPLNQIPGLISREPGGENFINFFIFLFFLKLVLTLTHCRKESFIILLIQSHLKKMWMRSM